MMIALLPSFCVDKYDYLAPYNQMDDVDSFTQSNSDDARQDEALSRITLKQILWFYRI